MTRALALSALLVAAPLAGCGGSDDGLDGEIEETGQPGVFGRVGEMQEAVEQMQEAAERPLAEPVNFRVLRDLLPEAVAGLDRTEVEGASQGTMGFSVSNATATYEGADGDGQIEIELTDLGALPQVGMFGLGWTLADMDKETSTGYEKTVRLGENKGYREYDTERERGEFSLLVAERFLVAVKGRNVEDAALEEALRAVDLPALAAMRDEGRQTT
jgi:hypothetical protein